MTGSKFRQATGLLIICFGIGAIPLAGATESFRIYHAVAIQADTSAVTPAVIDAGRKIFHGKGMCFACHGTKLEGGPVAPPLKPHNWKDAKGGDLNAILYVDTHGVAGTLMVPHPGGISDAEAVQVASYIWAVSHRGAKP